MMAIISLVHPMSCIVLIVKLLLNVTVDVEYTEHTIMDVMMVIQTLDAMHVSR